jgi:DNA-binding transcriptional ArsR family regulator
MSQSLVSHHLADLTTTGFVERKREGKYIDYYLTKKGEQFIQALLLMMSKKGGG